MIGKHPGIESISFPVRVKFDAEENEYEASLNLHEMHRLVVGGDLPVSIRMQRDIIEAKKKNGEPIVSSGDDKQES